MQELESLLDRFLLKNVKLCRKYSEGCGAIFFSPLMAAIAYSIGEEQKIPIFGVYCVPGLSLYIYKVEILRTILFFFIIIKYLFDR